MMAVANREHQTHEHTYCTPRSKFLDHFLIGLSVGAVIVGCFFHRETIMANSHPPSFDFFASDFYAKTAHMTPAEVGVYIRLMCQQWFNGSIPRDKAQLSRMSICSLEEFNRAWQAVGEKFESSDETGDSIVNPKLAAQREFAMENWSFEKAKQSKRLTRKQLSEIRSNAGKQGGRPPADKSKTTKQNQNKANGKREVGRGKLSKKDETPPTEPWIGDCKYQSPEFRECWQRWLTHVAACIGRDLPSKTDCDLMRLNTFDDEAKAITWINHSIQVSRAGNLCDPEYFTKRPDEPDEDPREAERRRQHRELDERIRAEKQRKRQMSN
jgi:uncharacterized protein YdaU (DUF1376 family)